MSNSLDRDLDRLKESANDKVNEAEELDELGMKFLMDKEKIEKEIEYVWQSNISDNDKRALIEELENAMVELQTQYEKDVTEENEKIQESLTEHTDTMQDVADELEKDADSFKKVTMDVASTDASKAADVADERKQVFEQAKEEYLEKQRALRFAADIQRKEIFRRNIRGR